MELSIQCHVIEPPFARANIILQRKGIMSGSSGRSKRTISFALVAEVHSSVGTVQYQILRAGGSSFDPRVRPIFFPWIN